MGVINDGRPLQQHGVLSQVCWQGRDSDRGSQESRVIPGTRAGGRFGGVNGGNRRGLFPFEGQAVRLVSGDPIMGAISGENESFSLLGGGRVEVADSGLRNPLDSVMSAAPAAWRKNQPASMRHYKENSAYSRQSVRSISGSRWRISCMSSR